MTAFANDVSGLIKSGTLFIRGDTCIVFPGKKEYLQYQLEKAYFSMDLLLIADTRTVSPQKPIIKILLSMSGKRLPESCNITKLYQYSESDLGKALNYILVDHNSPHWENDLPVIFTKNAGFPRPGRASNGPIPEPCSWNDSYHLLFFQYALHFLKNPDPQEISRINNGKKVLDTVAKHFAGFIEKAVQANQLAKSFVME